MLFERNLIGSEQRMAVAPGNFLDWQQGATTIEHMTVGGRRVKVIRMRITAAGRRALSKLRWP